MISLFVADPAQGLNPGTDTTLYMLREALRRSWRCFWTTPQDVYWRGGGVEALAREVRSCAPQALADLKEPEILELNGGADVVFVRQEPPVDADYISLCWLLAGYENRVRMINPASLLIRYHEKMLPMDGVAGGRLDADDILPTCVSRETERFIEFVKELESDRIVIKPWLGYGGREIRRMDKKEFLNDPEGVLTGGGRWMIQPYDPEVEKTGDRRGFFFNGKYYGSVGRMPKPGGFIANFAQGGSAADQRLSQKEEVLIKKMERWLKTTGIVFAGSDFIGGRLSEVNITCPTGFAAYEKLYGENPARALFDDAFGHGA